MSNLMIVNIKKFYSIVIMKLQYSWKEHMASYIATMQSKGNVEPFRATIDDKLTFKRTYKQFVDPLTAN